MSESKTVIVQGLVFTHENILTVVDRFYRQVAVDPVLSQPFQSVQDWSEHIQKMTHFWWIRFGGKPYLFNEYNPVPKHFFAGFNEIFLARWLQLFHEILEVSLEPAQARLWMAVSEAMGQGLLMKNEVFKNAYEAHSKRS